MAKGFDILHVKSAVKARNKFDLSRTHLTTMDFGEIVPLFVEETVPGDDIKVTGNYFSRMAPLVKPTYGKFSFKTMTSFVPYHQIASDADAWIVGKTAFEGETPMQRWFSLASFVQFIITYCVTTSGATSANSVFNYVNLGGTQVYNVFTDKGKYWIKVMNALGYSLPEGVDLRSSASWQNVAYTRLSAYPLLAFFKAYNDYMSQSQRFNSSALSGFLRAVKFKKSATGFNTGNGALDETALNLLFSNLFLNYENDYFVSAWQYQNSAIGTNGDIASTVVPGNSLEQANNDSLNTKLITSNGAFTEISQRSLDWLQSYDNWVRRNNYSGSRAVQEVYSRFGIKTDDYKCDYAYVLGTDTMPIQVGDVTATADATGVPLGDYAGKGIMTGSKGVSYKVNDYGILLILGYFTVVPMQAFGSDRRVLRSSPLDYYTPEFDGMGAEAISFGEVYACPITDVPNDTTYDTNVFGYTERYNSYRYGRDVITGEFRDYRKNGDMNVWHTGRNLTDIRLAGNMIAQSTAMNTLPQTGSEYNRIFSLGSGNENHFYMTAHFNVEAIRPMLNLNQVPRLGEGDTTVPRNGNVIS